MKTLLLCLSLLISTLSVSANAAEPWKGHTETSPLEVGVMTGLSVYGTQTGWGFLPSVAYLIVPEGWADDIDERIWLEAEGGPSFFTMPTGASVTPFQYSVHMRWDFTYNEYWTFYGLGGISGYALPTAMGGAFALHPRFGVGVEYQTKTPLMFRGEVSGEFMGAGIAFNF